MKIYLIAILTLFSCTQQNSTAQSKIDLSKYETAYFASGCFWCVEAIFESVNGVIEVQSGYAGGSSKNPTYKNVSAGKTNHAEAVRIYYDKTLVSYQTLLEVFFGSHDPTTLNQQGPDVGKQYRSIAFFENEIEKKEIESLIETFEKENTFDGSITTEIKKLNQFYIAEEYHQNYEHLHPENPYVKAVSLPRLNRFKKKFPHLLNN